MISAILKEIEPQRNRASISRSCGVTICTPVCSIPVVITQQLSSFTETLHNSYYLLKMFQYDEDAT